MLHSEKQQEILDHMPQFIALNYRDMLAAPDARIRVQAGLAVLDRSLRLLTIILVSQYLIRNKQNFSEPLLNKQLIQWQKKDEPESWFEVLLVALDAYEGRREWLFVPEIYDIYWDTSDVERHSVNPETEDLLKQVAVQLSDSRNLQVRGTEWQELELQVGNLVDRLCEKLAFLSHYGLMRIHEAIDDLYVAKRYMGMEITEISFQYEGPPLQPNLYYLSNKDFDDFLELNPLLTSWREEQKEHEETALFRCLTGYDELGYLLALSGNPIIETPERHRRDRFVRLIGAIREHKEKQESRQLTWLLFAATVEQVTGQAWVKAVKDRFDQTLYVQRENLLALFGEFLASDARCFLLTGRSGTGKSSFVMSLLDAYATNKKLCTLIIDASLIDTRDGLDEFIRKQFELQKLSLPHPWWSAVNQMPDVERYTVLLVLDGINESEHAQELLKQIKNMLIYSPDWLKVLITSRPEAWQRIYQSQNLQSMRFFRPQIASFGLDRDLPPLAAFDMKPFSQEELDRAYGLYQKKYSLQTSFETLTPVAREVIQDPLHLWLVARTYQGDRIPPSLPINELVPKFVDGLKETRRLTDDEIQFLEQELVPLMSLGSGKYTRFITPAALEEAGGTQLRERVFSKKRLPSGELANEPFQHLADAQIVVKVDRGNTKFIRFTHERFSDYYLGRFLFFKKIRPASSTADAVSVCRELTAAIEGAPFLWGAVEYALYQTLGEKPEVIQDLAFTDSPDTAYLVSVAMEGYTRAQPDQSKIDRGQTDPQAVQALINGIITQSTARRSVFSLNQRLQATEAALRVARTLDYKEPFIKVLLHRETLEKRSGIRDAGVKHSYYLSKQAPRTAIEILEAVCAEIPKPAFSINLPALRSTINLAPLLVLDCYEEGEQADPIVQDLIDILRNTLNDTMNKPLFRLAEPIVRRVLIRIGANLLKDLAGKGQSDTVLNAYELGRFFAQSDPLRAQAVRAQARNALQYLDWRSCSLDDIGDLIVRLVQTGDRTSELIAEYIILIHGIHKPSEARMAIYRMLEEVDNPACNSVKESMAAHAWYALVERQPKVSPQALATQKDLTLRWLRQNQHGYGIIKRYDGPVVQYYWLHNYGALWTKAHPGVQVDLFQELMEQAIEDKDRALQLHIIDTFGDLRDPMHDYRAPLRVLIPCIHDTDDQVVEHLAQSLGTLHGQYPTDVDHFLVESDAPASLVNLIHRYSDQKPSHHLYMSTYRFMGNLMAYAPVEFVHEFIGVLDTALQAKSFGKMAEILVDKSLDMLISASKEASDQSPRPPRRGHGES